MNKTYQYIFRLLLVASIAGTLFSCKKDAYLTDGGTSQAYTSLSTYDYLKNHQYHYFDTVVLLIDHFNLKDSVNKAGTFFAFTDFSVQSLMTLLNCETLNQLYDSVSSKLITQYLFSDSSITLANTTATAVQRANWAGAAALSAIKKVQQSYGINLTNSAPVFNYYTLQYIKINGVLDGSPGAPANDKADVALSCQTTGIKTSSGTTLHVLSNNAALNKL